MLRKEIAIRRINIIDVKDYDKIIINNQFRNDFINDFSDLRITLDKEVFLKLILKYLQKRKGVDFDTDLIEIAILMNDFSNDIYDEIRWFLLKKKSSLTKLISIDYINHYFNFISIDDYKYLTNYCLIRAKTNSLYFQLLLNSTLFSSDILQSIEKILFILKQEKYPTLFYRFNNNISYLNQFKFIKNIVFDDYSVIINNSSFNKDVKKELLKELRSS